MSQKNILQELYQKAGLQLPKYETIATSSVPPAFKSTVTVLYQGKSLTLTGEICRNKKDAEKSAAQLALTVVNGGIVTCTTLNIPENTKVWVDADAAPLTRIISCKFPNEAIKFVCAKDTPNSFVKHASLHALKVNGRDAVDYYIAFDVARYFEEKKGRTAIIVSKDNFVETLMNILPEFNIKGVIIWFNEVDQVINKFATP